MSSIIKNLIKKFDGLFDFDDLNILKENLLFFIYGSEALPMPLSSEEEKDLLYKLSIDYSEDLVTTLVEHNIRLVIYIAKKFENTGVENEDLISIGAIGLIKAVRSYDFSKNIKLATYASRCIENEILMYLRKIVKQKKDISLDEPLNVDCDGNELLFSDMLFNSEENIGQKLEDDEEKRFLYKALDGLNDNEKLLMEMRFGLNGRKEFTQKEVADVLGISQSYISRLEKKIFGHLKKIIQKMNS